VTVRTDDREHESHAPTTWGLYAAAGYAWTIQNIVSFHAGAAIMGDVPFGSREAVIIKAAAPTIAFGSVLSLGYRPLPLVQVYVSRRLSLDAYASWAVDLRSRDVLDRYLAGLSWTF
jgi:hypothetical protein